MQQRAGLGEEEKKEGAGALAWSVEKRVPTSFVMRMYAVHSSHVMRCAHALFSVCFKEASVTRNWRRLSPGHGLGGEWSSKKRKQYEATTAGGTKLLCTCDVGSGTKRPKLPAVRSHCAISII